MKFIGNVVSGKNIGKTLGFPTINIDIDNKTEKTLFGVYIVSVILDKIVYFGMCNLGPKPTFEDLIANLEVHLFEFKGTIVDKKVEVTLLHKIRETVKFEKLEELIIQLNKDKEYSLNFLHQKSLL